MGKIEDIQQDKLIINVKNKFKQGDSLELITPMGSYQFQLKYLENKHGETISCAPGSGHKITINLPENIQSNEISNMALLMKDL